jgi:hypothetical protein
VGRILTPGFGLSTCDRDELVRCVGAIKREAGLPGEQSAKSMAQSAGRHAPRAMRSAPNVIRLASLAQIQFARTLEEQLHINMDEAQGIIRKAKLPGHPRTSRDVSVYIQALLSIKQRRLRAASEEANADRRAG